MSRQITLGWLHVLVLPSDDHAVRQRNAEGITRPEGAIRRSAHAAMRRNTHAASAVAALSLSMMAWEPSNPANPFDFNESVNPALTATLTQTALQHRAQAFALAQILSLGKIISTQHTLTVRSV